MRVVLTALALMAFAFFLNLMGDLSAVSATRGDVEGSMVSVHAPIASPPRQQRILRPPEAVKLSPLPGVRAERLAAAEKPRKCGGLSKHVAPLLAAAPPSLKYASQMPKPAAPDRALAALKARSSQSS